MDIEQFRLKPIPLKNGTEFEKESMKFAQLYDRLVNLDNDYLNDLELESYYRTFDSNSHTLDQVKKWNAKIIKILKGMTQ